MGARCATAVLSTAYRIVILGLVGLVLAGLGMASPVHAAWPLTWDNDGAADDAIATRLGPNGDLYLLATSDTVGDPPHAVLLRVDPEGNVVWTGIDLDMRTPLSFALRPDGGVLVTGRETGNTLRATSFAAVDGSVQWSRTRADVTWSEAFFGPDAEPIWSVFDAGWWIPMRQGDDFAVVGYDAVGDPLPDWTWTPPNGPGGASTVRPLLDGGLYVGGSSDGDFGPDGEAPGWWIVATDEFGSELWSHFEDGDTPAGNFSNAFLLESANSGEGATDAVIAWADDETAHGVFSLRLWSLDPDTGDELWAATWPPPGLFSFTPQSVVVSDDRVVASGFTDAFGNFGDAVAISFDAATGDVVWERIFSGGTRAIETAVVTDNGSALLATSLFPSPNPGPTRVWTSTWNRAGDACSPPQEILPARIVGAVRAGPDLWLIAGNGSEMDTLNDVVVQQLADPCTFIFANGFESGDTTGWSSSVP